MSFLWRIAKEPLKRSNYKNRGEGCLSPRISQMDVENKELSLKSTKLKSVLESSFWHHVHKLSAAEEAARQAAPRTKYPAVGLRAEVGAPSCKCCKE